MLQKTLKTALENNNFNFSPVINDKFISYLNLLNDWNRVFNLTAIRDPNDMVMLHLIDSLVINPYLHGTNIIDVGTGAGLPGIPLALINPEKNFVLLDSNSKKTRFLTQAILELKISNIEVIHSRCENFQPEKCFDSILSRAFASIQVMLEATRHLICKHGQFLAMKGLFPEEEIKAIPPNFVVVAVHELRINGLDAKRHLVCIKECAHG